MYPSNNRDLQDEGDEVSIGRKLKDAHEFSKDQPEHQNFDSTKTTNQNSFSSHEQQFFTSSLLSRNDVDPHATGTATNFTQPQFHRLSLENKIGGFLSNKDNNRKLEPNKINFHIQSHQFETVGSHVSYNSDMLYSTNQPFSDLNSRTRKSSLDISLDGSDNVGMKKKTPLLVPTTLPSAITSLATNMSNTMKTLNFVPNNKVTKSLLEVLHEGDSYVESTHYAITRANNIEEALLNTYRRIVLMIPLLERQLASIAALLHWIWNYNGRKLHQIENMLARDEIFVKIDEVCESLRNKYVHPDLVAGEEGHSLYDFVDEASIENIKTQAKDGIKELFIIHERNRQFQLNIERHLLYFDKCLYYSKKILSVEDKPDDENTFSSSQNSNRNLNNYQNEKDKIRKEDAKERKVSNKKTGISSIRQYLLEGNKRILSAVLEEGERNELLCTIKDCTKGLEYNDGGHSLSWLRFKEESRRRHNRGKSKSKNQRNVNYHKGYDNYEQNTLKEDSQTYVNLNEEMNGSCSESSQSVDNDGEVILLKTPHLDEELKDFIDLPNFWLILYELNQDKKELEDLLRTIKGKLLTSATKYYNESGNIASSSSASSLALGEDNFFHGKSEGNSVYSTSLDTSSSAFSLADQLSNFLLTAMDRVQDTCKHLEKIPLKHDTLLQHLHKLLTRLIQFTEDIAKQIDIIRQEHENDFQAVLCRLEDVVFNELNSLCLFYSNFEISHIMLGPEVQRRKEALHDMKTIIENAEEHLQKMLEEENQKRGEFFANYGQFLPDTLCPTIHETLEAFTISPSINEIIARLPKSSIFQASPDVKES